MVFDSRPSGVISLVDWKEDFLSKDYSKDYRKQILSKFHLIFKKHTYKSEELVNVISDNYVNINKSDRSVKLVRLILNYCEEKELLTDQQLTTCRKKLKNKKTGRDNYVPTDQEVKETLSKLCENNKLIYMLYLASGIRKSEGNYILENIKKLKVQEFNGFIKISMNYLRKTKNSYFCYLPSKFYNTLLTSYKQLSISSLENEIKRNGLIPIKYCRKWFYTKCIELGIPESIADYYQGRTGNSIGSNHYLSRQLLGDKNYSKIVRYLNNLNNYILI